MARSSLSAIAATIDGHKGPSTRVIDAGGNTVVPGFIEAHMHLFAGAAELPHLQLFGVHGFDALQEAVRAYAAEHPDARLLQAQGADYTILSADERVTRHHLDRIIADRPFAMSAPDHHTMWANTKALQLAGLINGKTLGPGNEIVMGADGLAEGELREGEAFGPLLDLAGESRARLGLATGGEPDPKPTPEEQAHDRAIMKRGLEWCARHGITSIHNMDGNLLPARAAVGDRGRRRPALPGADTFPLQEFHDARRAREGVDDGRKIRFRMAVVGHGEGLLRRRAGFLDGRHGRRLRRPAGLARRAAVFAARNSPGSPSEADRRGLQIAVHAIGDGAVRAVLDGYEAAQKKNGKRDSRHRIEHIEVTTEQDVPRFAELGVLASMQPPHPPGAMGFPLEPTVSRIGRHRWPLSYAWRTLKNAGARIVFASDWPVSPIDPIAGMQAAMLRKPWAEGMPDHSFSFHEALAGYTVEGAYAEFMEDRKGRLKPGYLADLVVLSGDFEAADPERLHEIRPVTTICGGKITYQA